MAVGSDPDAILIGLVAAGGTPLRELMACVDLTRPWVSVDKAIGAMTVLSEIVLAADEATLPELLDLIDSSGIPRASVVMGQPDIGAMPALADRLGVEERLWRSRDQVFGDDWENHFEVDLQSVRENGESDLDLPSLPDGIVLHGDLNLTNRHDLRRLPDDLVVHGILKLDGCVNLRSWPKGLRVDGFHWEPWAINTNGCPLKNISLPDDAIVSGRAH